MHISNVIFVILFLLISGVSGAQEREPAGQIKVLMESCQFSQAITLAELFLSKDSARTDLLLLKARSLAAGFQNREAISALLKAQQTDSTNITVLNELVDVYLQSGDQEKAIATNLKICGQVPDNRYFRLIKWHEGYKP